MNLQPIFRTEYCKILSCRILYDKWLIFIIKTVDYNKQSNLVGQSKIIDENKAVDYQLKILKEKFRFDYNKKRVSTEWL